MSVAFMTWYLLYVVMSVYAGDIMEIALVGSVNVVFAFGALRFAGTFGIALLYSRYFSWRLDPLADELNVELDRPIAVPVISRGLRDGRRGEQPPPDDHVSPGDGGRAP